MSSTINAVVGMVPPRRATGAVIAHPATTAASLPSSRMGARDRAQSWRGKYLRALNICPEDIELARRNSEKAANGKARMRAMSFHRSDYPDHLALSRSYSSSTEKEDEERKSLEKSTQMLFQQQQHHREHQQGHFAAHRTIPHEHHIRGVPLRAPSTNLHHHRPTSTAIPMMPTASNPYGFATRPNMARGRRCHTDPFELQERVSAPIQIPSAMGGNNQLDGNERHDKYMSGGQRRRASPQSTQGDLDGVAANNHTPNVRLLSWEEPVAMLAAADAVTKGWRMPHASAMSSMELGVRRGRRNEQQESNMEEDEEEDDHDTHGGDIFAMDDSEDDAGDMSDNQLTSQTIPPMARSKSRRRYRTESMNTVTSGREKRTHHEYDDYDDQDHHHVVSQSFVPPHQMVDRSNLFSIGLRDELKKRRPANPI